MAYQDYVKTKTQVHNVYLKMSKAFVTGGTICVIGQFFMNFCKNAGCTEEISGTRTSLMLVLLRREGHGRTRKEKKEGKGISGLCQNKDTSAQRLSEYGKSICDRRNHLCDRAVFYEFL